MPAWPGPRSTHLGCFLPILRLSAPLLCRGPARLRRGPHLGRLQAPVAPASRPRLWSAAACRRFYDFTHSTQALSRPLDPTAAGCRPIYRRLCTCPPQEGPRPPGAPHAALACGLCCFVITPARLRRADKPVFSFAWSMRACFRFLSSRPKGRGFRGPKWRDPGYPRSASALVGTNAKLSLKTRASSLKSF